MSPAFTVVRKAEVKPGQTVVTQSRCGVKQPRHPSPLARVRGGCDVDWPTNGILFNLEEPDKSPQSLLTSWVL